MDAPADAGPPQLPGLFAGNRLKLWFTADFGVKCSGGRVTEWDDISGTSFEGGTAAAVAYPNAKGPECQVAGHTLNGVSLPFFNTPTVDASVYVDETLSLPELSGVLSEPDSGSNTEYTIYVVERRWADFPNIGRASFILGTECNGCSTNGALQLGYVYYAGQQFTLDQTGNGGRVDVPTVPNTPPIAASFDMVRFGSADGGAYHHEIWINGANTGAGLANTAVGMLNLVGGSIGRAYATAADCRFDGDIAEILVFDTFINDTDRAALDAYLKKHWGL